MNARFALAIPHQAPQNMPGGGLSPAFHTGIWDLQTLHRYDKSPIAGITGRFPYPD